MFKYIPYCTWSCCRDFTWFNGLCTKMFVLYAFMCIKCQHIWMIISVKCYISYFHKELYDQTLTLAQQIMVDLYHDQKCRRLTGQTCVVYYVKIMKNIFSFLIIVCYALGWWICCFKLNSCSFSPKVKELTFMRNSTISPQKYVCPQKRCKYAFMKSVH